jgi:hypothetical protein
MFHSSLKTRSFSSGTILRKNVLAASLILRKISCYRSFKLGAPAVETILVEDVLATLPSKTAIMKIDVENLECKVRQ